MKRLGCLPNAADRRGAGFRVTIEAANRVRIAIHGMEPIAGYEVPLNDDEAWGSRSKRPDGLIIPTVDGEPFVCFVELKGGFDEKAFSQLEAGIRHFCPEAAHGSAHHKGFAAGVDLPHATAARRRRIPIQPTPSHSVFGIVVVSRRGTRQPPREFQCAGRNVRLLVLQRHGGRAEMTAQELATELGVS